MSAQASTDAPPTVQIHTSNNATDLTSADTGSTIENVEDNIVVAIFARDDDGVSVQTGAPQETAMMENIPPVPSVTSQVATVATTTSTGTLAEVSRDQAQEGSSTQHVASTAHEDEFQRQGLLTVPGLEAAKSVLVTWAESLESRPKSAEEWAKKTEPERRAIYKEMVEEADKASVVYDQEVKRTCYSSSYGRHNNSCMASSELLSLFLEQRAPGRNAYLRRFEELANEHEASENAERMLDVSVPPEGAEAARPCPSVLPSTRRVLERPRTKARTRRIEEARGQAEAEEARHLEAMERDKEGTKVGRQAFGGWEDLEMDMLIATMRTKMGDSILRRT